MSTQDRTAKSISLGTGTGVIIGGAISVGAAALGAPGLDIALTPVVTGIAGALGGVLYEGSRLTREAEGCQKKPRNRK
jgi:hypothetical protein